jgi:F0F1-type ATP synthase membrane subunit b/b'
MARLQPVIDPERELPIGETRALNPQWNQTAAQVGNTLGQAVNRMREAPRRAQQAAEQIRSEIRDGLEGIREHARPERLRQEAEGTIDELQSRARERSHLVRNRLERLMREKPVGIVVAALVAAFIAGMGLRIWRSNRD